MPFTNEIAGGNGALVRNWLQSQNFVTGVSGWRIEKNGNVEFNAGTFRSSVQVGVNPGAHIILDATTDAFLIYNAANQLIASITPTNQTISGVAVKAGIVSYDPVTPTKYVRLVGSQIQLSDTNTTPTAGASIIDTNNQAAHGGQVVLILESGSINGNAQSFIQLVSQSFDGTVGAFIQMTQGGITGKAVQNDNPNTPALIHAMTFSVNTDGFGNAAVPHGASFTPTQGWLASNMGAGLWQTYAWSSNFTNVSANANFKNPGGTNYANATATGYGLFIG